MPPHSSSYSRRRTAILLVAHAVALFWLLASLIVPSALSAEMLINTEAQQLIDDTDGGANPSLKFGQTLGKTVSFDRATDRFTLNDDVYVAGSVLATGTQSGRALTIMNGTSYMLGSLGIGTTSPKAKLAVLGTISGATVYATQSFSGAGLTDCSNATASKLLWSGTTGRFSCGTDQSGGAGGGWTDDGTVVRLTDGTDNVGIGTTSPGAKLHISSGAIIVHDANGSANNRLSLSYDGLNGIAVIGANSTSGNTELKLGTSNAGVFATKMTVKNDGNVGIGATSPAAKLQIVPSSNSEALRIGSLGGISLIGGGYPVYTSNAVSVGTSFDFENPEPNASVGMAIVSPMRSPSSTSVGGVFVRAGNATAGTDVAWSTFNTALAWDTTGNVGIGKTAPGAKLDVAGTISGSLLYVSPGSATSPSLAFSGDTNTGLYWVSADKLSVVTGGTNRLTIDSSGNVGIGTTSPASKLAVNGNIEGGLLYLGGGSAAAPAIASVNDTGADTGIYWPGTPTGNALAITTGGSEKVRIDSSGNVGVGTTTPGSKLEIFGSTETNAEIGTIMLRSSATSTKKMTLGWSDTADAGYIAPVQSGVAWKNLLLNPHGGNVGIGTTSPEVRLEVVGSLSGSALYGAGLADCDTASTSKLLWDVTTGRFSCGTDQSGGAGGGWTDDGTVIRLTDGTDNVGIGTTSPGSKLEIANNGAVDVRIDNANTGNATLTLDRQTTGGESKVLLLDGGVTQWGVAARATTNNFVVRDGDSTERLTIQKTDGNVGIGTTAPEVKLEVVGTISGSTLTTNNLLNSTSATSGSVLVSRTGQAPEWKAPTGSMVWFLDGGVAVGPSQGAAVTLPFGMTLTSVTLRATGAPTGAALIVDARENGTTLFSTKPQINDGATSGGGSAVFSDTVLAAGSVVTVDVTQVGSTFTGSGVTIQLNGVRTY